VLPNILFIQTQKGILLLDINTNQILTLLKSNDTWIHPMSLRKNGDVLLLSTCDNKRDTSSKFLQIIEIHLNDDFKPKERFVSVDKVAD